MKIESPAFGLLEIDLLEIAVNLGPNIKIRVAESISQGKIRRKVCAEVRSSRIAPTAPPARLTLTSDSHTRRGTFK